MEYKFIWPLFCFFFLSISVSAREFKSIHQIESEKYKTLLPITDYRLPVTQSSPFPGPPKVKKEIFGFRPHWLADYSNYHWDLLTTVAYFSAELNTDGTISTIYNWPETNFINTAHENGAKVVLTATLFNTKEEPDRVHTLISNSTYRNNTINNLFNEINGNGDGVCIDFEFVGKADKEDFNTFIQELTEKFHPDYSVYICVPGYKWAGYDAQYLALHSDGLFVMAYDYHWAGCATAGAVAPFIWNGINDVTSGVRSYLEGEGGASADKLIVGVPWYGYDWQTETANRGASILAYDHAVTYEQAVDNITVYGRLWDTLSFTPWYRYKSGQQWHQCWYEDPEALRQIYALVNREGLLGAGIWALNYEGIREDMWEKISQYFAAPQAPMFKYIRNTGDGQLNIKWFTNSESDLDHYNLYKSTDGTNFALYQQISQTEISTSDLSFNTVYYFKLTAVNTDGYESDYSCVLAAQTVGAVLQLSLRGAKRRSNPFLTARLPRSFQSLAMTKWGYATPSVDYPVKVLLVNDDFRFQPQNYVVYYAKAMDRAFDSANSKAIVDGLVNLADYEAVIWWTGMDSNLQSDTIENRQGTFTSAEQTKIISYLENGGKLFVNGQDIGFDLEGQGNGVDFFHNYLKASYGGDDSNNFDLIGIAGTIFEGINFKIDEDDGIVGEDSAYDAVWPDTVTACSGSYKCLEYGTGHIAGVAYEGTFGGGTEEGKIITFGFPFETIIEAGKRAEVVSRIMDWFEVFKDTTPPEIPEVTVNLPPGKTEVEDNDVPEIVGKTEANARVYSVQVKDQNGNVLISLIRPSDFSVDSKGQITGKIDFGDIFSRRPWVTSITVEIVVEDSSGNKSAAFISEPFPVKPSSNVICYPNPFILTDGKQLHFYIELAATGEVEIKIFNIAGELVRKWEPEERDKGRYDDISWDGKNQDNCSVASGIYLVWARIGDAKFIRKIGLVK